LCFYGRRGLLAEDLFLLLEVWHGAFLGSYIQKNEGITMNYNFDQGVDRRGSDSVKWKRYGEDVLPMWVADMDFQSPPALLDAVHKRVDHGVFGYSMPPQALIDTIVDRMQQRHNMTIQGEDIKFLPGLVSGLNLMCRAIGEPGDGVLIKTPVYMPFLSAPGNQGREVQSSEMVKTTVTEKGQSHIHYEIDFDAFEAAITERTRLFILCNPHNPLGRAFTRAELERMAEICLKHDLIICSDEIHCDLMMDGTPHVSIASLSPDIAARTATLIAPSKTFNVPGLGNSAVIAQNPELMALIVKAAAGIIPHPNVLGYYGTLAGFTQCQDWHDELLAYLTANRNFLVEYVNEQLPDVTTTRPEGTYLAWLDFSQTAIAADPHKAILEQAKVGLSDGPTFGAGGEGFVRVNYGCPRSTLQEGLDRIRGLLVG